MNSTRAPRKKIVLFHRDFQGFTGGHLKVWNYFNHVIDSPAFEPRITFTPTSRLDATNPWRDSQQYFSEWKPEKADLLFLAGTDWRALSDSQRAKPPKPVINLIQHQRHADVHSGLRGFLKHRATRICVSEEVAAAIKATGEVNGPVHIIPNGIDFSAMPRPLPIAERKIDMLFCGLKAPELAEQISAQFRRANRTVEVLKEWMPRGEFLQRLTNAKITIFLPRPIEGFYLPALEGMAAGTLVVCPDCDGNRSFCQHGVNCLRPKNELRAISQAAVTSENLKGQQRMRMLEHARATVDEHSLAGEREKFLRILTQIEL